MKALVTAAAFAGVALGGYGGGLHWNSTPSMPLGLWRLAPLHGAVSRGDTVALCLPEAPARLGLQRGYLNGGDCPGHTEVLIKPVAAVAGDRVEVSEAGISVNGVRVRNSKPLPHDDAGRWLKAIDKGVYTVGENEVWVLSNRDARSFDSRDDGPVLVTEIRDHASPFLIFSR